MTSLATRCGIHPGLFHGRAEHVLHHGVGLGHDADFPARATSRARRGRQHMSSRCRADPARPDTNGPVLDGRCDGIDDSRPGRPEPVAGGEAATSLRRLPGGPGPAPDPSGQAGIAGGACRGQTGRDLVATWPALPPALGGDGLVRGQRHGQAGVRWSLAVQPSRMTDVSKSVLVTDSDDLRPAPARTAQHRGCPAVQGIRQRRVVHSEPLPARIQSRASPYRSAVSRSCARVAARRWPCAQSCSNSAWSTRKTSRSSVPLRGRLFAAVEVCPPVRLSLAAVIPHDSRPPWRWPNVGSGPPCPPLPGRTPRGSRTRPHSARGPSRSGAGLGTSSGSVPACLNFRSAPPSSGERMERSAFARRPQQPVAEFQRGQAVVLVVVPDAVEDRRSIRGLSPVSRACSSPRTPPRRHRRRSRPRSGGCCPMYSGSSFLML